MSDQKVDILVLGATGLTGRLITRYLLAHPDRSKFSFAIAARSRSKLDRLKEELNISSGSGVEEWIVDVLKDEEVEHVVKRVKVVINTVGPFWKWGTAVVRACASNGIHYVDLTGETPWLKRIITQYDYLATKTHSIIVPSCGLDSLPFDVSAHLANKSIKAYNLTLGIDTSTTGCRFKGSISSGTLSSLFTALEEVPVKEARDSMKDFSLSPVVGESSPRLKLIYKTYDPETGKHLIGGVSPMAMANRAIVQRTWGLLERELSYGNNSERSKIQSYGSKFKYEEMVEMPNSLAAIVFSIGFASFIGALAIPPIRWLIKKFSSNGFGGFDDQKLESGILKITTITKSTTTPDHPNPVFAKTTFRGKGDPGYLLTSIMIAESALTLLHDAPSLPPLSKQGGILTTMTAMGDVLIERLKKTGRFEIESSIVQDKKNV